MTSEPKTKNDVAWKQLFDKYGILDEVKQKGQFLISSAQINTVRESRLMAKFDHSVNLPQIFRDHALSILPISRSKYIIAPLVTHQTVTYAPDTEIVPVQLPSSIKSIDYSNLYSEAIALNYAFNAGIIDDLVEETTFHTISGRMSTESFSFFINSRAQDQAPYQVNVDNSQCEIDGGFEGAQHFALVEAKNYTVNDFLIRQLYYPYRLWSKKLSKKVVPILMTFSPDTLNFNFFIYEFTNEAEYNSLRLVQQRSYAIASEAITTDEISALLSHVHLVPEPQSIPFPQADRFDRVVELLSLLAKRETGELTRDDITENYQFDARQTNYYTDAARYIGLIDKFINKTTREITFRLTNEAQKLLHKDHKRKHLGLIRKILEHVVYYKAFELALQQGKIPTKGQISQIIKNSRPDIGGTTPERRASTVRGWIEWIWKQIDD